MSSTPSLEWDYQGIGWAQDEAAYVIDTNKARGERRWWSVRYVPAGQKAERDTRTHRQFPHIDRRPAPAGMRIGETTHSEARAHQIAERHNRQRLSGSSVPAN